MEKISEEVKMNKNIYCVYTDGKTPDHSFIDKEWPKESLEKYTHIKELFRGTKEECSLFRKNERNEYFLNKAIKIIGSLTDKKLYKDNLDKAKQFLSEVKE